MPVFQRPARVQIEQRIGSGVMLEKPPEYQGTLYPAVTGSVSGGRRHQGGDAEARIAGPGIRYHLAGAGIAVVHLAVYAIGIDSADNRCPREITCPLSRNAAEKHE